LPLPRPFRACHPNLFTRQLRCDRALVGAVLVLAGCGDPNAADLAPVQGTVYLKGQRLADANIIFTPTGSTRGLVSVGRTGPDGRYSLKTVRGRDGATPGEYKVSLANWCCPKGPTRCRGRLRPDGFPAKESLPGQYSSAEHRKLIAIVQAGGAAIDFQLKDP